MDAPEKDTPRNVIFSLSPGILITIRRAGTTSYLTPTEPPNGNGELKIVGCGNSGVYGDFVMYKVVFATSNGETVKVGLKSNIYNLVWSSETDSKSNCPNSIALRAFNGHHADTFILEPSPGGDFESIIIKKAEGKPPPFIQVRTVPGVNFKYPAYGFNAAGMSGIFQLAIVG